jgi:hypothetical protein
VYPNVLLSKRQCVIYRLKLLTVSSLKNQSEDEESDESKNTRWPSPTKAFAAFETSIKWLETQDECCPAQLPILKGLQNLAAKNCISAIRLTKNDQFVKK